MGLMDNIKGKAEELKGKASGLVDEHGDQVGDGLDKGRDFASEKTGGKYDDKLDDGTTRAKDSLDGLDGQNDDIS